MRFIYPILIFLFFWGIVGTGITLLFSLIGLEKLNGFAVGPIIGVILGLYFAYNKFKKYKKK